MRKDLFAELYETRGTDPRVSSERTKELFNLGFLAGADLWYDFAKYGIDAYVNDKDYKDIHPINGKFSSLISDKRYLPIVFATKPHYLPDFYCAIDDGKVRFVCESGRPVLHRYQAETLMENKLAQHGKLVVKPVNLSMGEGIDITDNAEYVLVRIKNDARLVISSVIENEDYAKQINPSTLNTYRLIFYKNRQGRNTIFRVIHRFGAIDSVVDNISKGGCASEVNLETGIMSRVIVPDGDILFRDDHPGTNQIISGVQIPDWDRKKEALQDIIDTLFFVDYAGVDVSPTPDGLKVVEINSSPDMHLQQFNRPALLDEEFKFFLQSKGYGENTCQK